MSLYDWNEFKIILLLVISGVTCSTVSKNPHYVGNRSVMVHLFEWTWNDIAEECEKFLGPKGYGGVQVSPVQENVVIPGRPWWERYQPISYKFSTRSGNEEEFRLMTRRCNEAGVRIYVDAVFNHMAGRNNKGNVGTGGSVADFANFEYPSVPYDKSDFHSPCDVNNYKDPENVRNCELVELEDLDQSKQKVRGKIVEFLNRAIDAGVAGFRIDAAKHMWPADLTAIYSNLKNLNTSHGFAKNNRPYVFQEVIDYGGSGESINKYQYNQLGAVTEFKYGYEISNALRGKNSLKWFINWGEKWSLLPSQDALTFIDNHDTQRSKDEFLKPLTYKDGKIYRAAVAFMLAHPYGTPRVMSSYEFENFDQGPPADSSGNISSPGIKDDGSCGNGRVCEYRWRQIYKMADFRNRVGNEALNSWWDDGAYQIAFCRGNRGFFAMNAGQSDMRQKIQVCLPAGEYCDIISGTMLDGRCTGKRVVVDENGMALIEIRRNEEDQMLAILFTGE